MNPPDINGLEILVNYVTQIRGQDLSHFQTLITIFMGTILAAILAAVLVDKGDGITGWRRWLAYFALALFCVFLFGLKTKHLARREFCHKWMGSNITSQKTVPALIEDFSRQRYGLYYAEPNDPNFKLRAENLPEGLFVESVWKHPFLAVDIFAYASLACALVLVFTRPSQKVKKNEINISGSSIETEGKLKIN
jgi:MFS family permease